MLSEKELETNLSSPHIDDKEFKRRIINNFNYLSSKIIYVQAKTENEINKLELWQAEKEKVHSDLIEKMEAAMNKFNKIFGMDKKERGQK
jgi:hypothetical protein